MHTRAGYILVTLILALACLSSLSALQQDEAALGAQVLSPGNPPLSGRHRALSVDLPDWMKDKERKAFLTANLESSRKDAVELASLAKELQADMNKPDFKNLSPECVARLNRIEKLAKKIRDELKVY